MEWYYVWWSWLTCKCVAQVCQHQLSFLFYVGQDGWNKYEFFYGFSDSPIGVMVRCNTKQAHLWSVRFPPVLLVYSKTFSCIGCVQDTGKLPFLTHVSSTLESDEVVTLHTFMGLLSRLRRSVVYNRNYHALLGIKKVWSRPCTECSGDICHIRAWIWKTMALLNSANYF